MVGPGELEFAVPDLPAGIYQLAVVEAGGEAWTSAPLEVWLVASLPPSEAGCRRSWRHVLRLARAGALPAEPGSPPPADDSRAALRLADDYRALLARLGSVGDLSAAAGELAAMEVSIIGDEIGRARLLFETELEVAEELAEEEPRCLLPLVVLHAEAYQVHHGGGRFPLATHSRRLAQAIAELAADALVESDERALLAVAITGLADMLESRRSSVEAQRLLERALSLDDSQEAARLLLAVSYERSGRYAEARREYEALVAANSVHFEARARLAILLRRLGETEEAERRLRILIAERPPAWLLSLCYQTLAQLLIRDARLAEAVRALEEGRERLPEDQALGVLLAYALDRSGERLAVRATLAGLPPGRAAVTPRYRYSDEPAVGLGLLRETLRQAVTVRLPVLALAAGDERAGGRAG